ncbi:alpha/beta hydrolase family protein [Avibacterium paragallinarum]|uniref:Alpha/beta hydrolase n=1 Tax=Avibacterium paragallinarum TaxID=728 RepID=A0AAE5WGH0_AVIPA|nr:alpha/beta hydrolase [Avibacterium paragallinarum]MEE3609067.1 alpha/beta hydrolase [Avibacterium paragallinarum]MEE3620278.1 alpha/beta hydrolase [Avibacterium paragallinarum]MEE3669100.1 alpha/beta hydrolase [Avibacterium paragallinarum]MEE3680641.1 alpha/beta hydrolase [Avibacterium paragallinarum]MEE4386243.1 alpha/beta hydrolase [Avibacterium paragallinarum]
MLSNRLPADRLALALEQEKAISAADYEKVKALAGIVRPLRSFIFKTPAAYDMPFEEWVIPSEDGVPLEAWFIPAKGGMSDKLVIFNHALPMCRAGFPGHFGLPWAGFDAVEIDFVIQYKHLTDAGYNVLTYDIRNHGNSGAANNGVCGIGNWEWRDCVGVKKFVDAHPELSKMKVALYSQCMGGNSQYRAIMERPDLFENVRCMVSPMVVSMAAIYDAFSELQGVQQYQPLIDLELLKMGGFTMAEMTPHLWANAVKMPTMIVQVLEDAWTRNPEDGQKTFDLLGAKEKELLWIENTPYRFKDGYNYFGRYPEKILAFINRYMAD